MLLITNALSSTIETETKLKSLVSLIYKGKNTQYIYLYIYCYSFPIILKKLRVKHFERYPSWWETRDRCHNLDRISSVVIDDDVTKYVTKQRGIIIQLNTEDCRVGLEKGLSNRNQWYKVF